MSTIIVKLTEKGREVEQLSGSARASIFDCLNEDEKKTFGEYLDRIIAQVGSEISEQGDEDFNEMQRKREKAYREFFASGERCDGPRDCPPHGKYGHRHGCGEFEPRKGEKWKEVAGLMDSSEDSIPLL